MSTATLPTAGDFGDFDDFLEFQLIVSGFRPDPTPDPDPEPEPEPEFEPRRSFRSGRSRAVEEAEAIAESLGIRRHRKSEREV